jgi:maltose O-acetyltransferase
MLAGETYTFLDPDLIAERGRAKTLLRLYNQTEDESDRHDLLRQLLGEVGRDSLVESPFYCTYGKNTCLGDGVYLNFSCVILDNNEVSIGHRVMIGPAVQIYTAAHPVEAKTRIQGWEVAKPIAIEDNVWIGGGAVILPGVTIGRNAVVGAGAVVTRSVPPNVVVAGNPARVIRRIESR